MKGLASSFVWWLGIDRNIEEFIKSVNHVSIAHHLLHFIPGSLREHTGDTYMQTVGPFLGHTFLLVTDAYSKWLEVNVISPANSTTTIEQLRSVFATHGLQGDCY